MNQQVLAPGLAVADALQQPVWTARADGEVDYANPYWRAYTGFGEDASLGGGWAVAVHPDDVATIDARFRAASAAGEPYEVEYRFRRADGIYRWHLARVAPIRNPAGTVVGWAGTATDVDQRKRAEDALRESEERYRTLFASIDEGFCVVEVLFDADGSPVDYRFLEANPAFERHTGLREAVGRTARELVPDLERHWFEIYGRVAATGQPIRFVDEATPMGGRSFDVYAFSIGAPEQRRVAILFTDVTERRQAEAVRERAHAAQRALAEAGRAFAEAESDVPALLATVARHAAAAVGDGCTIWLLEGQERLRAVAADHVDPDILAASREAFAGIEHDPAAGIVGRVVTTGEPVILSVLDPAELRARAHPAYQELLTRFPAYGLLATPLRARGRVLGVVATSRSAPGRPYGTADLVLLQELADRAAMAIDNARLFRDAQAAETRYRGLFEGVADAILVADADRRYRDANAAATALLGFTQEELLGLRVEEIVAASPGWTEAEFARFRREGRWHGELELRRKDGTTVPVEARATVVDLPEGPVNISALRDVSERVAAQRQQQEFLEAVSHDLKNPLAAVRAQAQLMDRRARRGGGEVVGLVESLATIETATRRMEAQLEELQDAARLRSGNRLELRIERVELVALAEEAVVEAQAATTSHRLRVEATAPAMVGRWDRLRLRRVLDNLLGNAIKYSSDGDVTVSVHEEVCDDGAWAVVAVRDEGVGIPADDLPHIFERYRRGSNVGARTRGAGIGLAGVRQIVEQHGGSVSVESVEGCGSCFFVRLPLVDNR